MRLVYVIVAAGIVCAVGTARAAQQSQTPTTAADMDVRVLHVQQNVYMLVGPGVNSAVQVGDDGVVVVDTMTAGAADKLVQAIRTLSSKPILQIVNTHVHSDHTGGNAIVANAGRFVANDQNAPAAGFGAGAPILATEHVLQDMTAKSGKYRTGSDLWPTESYFEDQRDLFRNGESIEVLSQLTAHSGGDSLVYFRRSDVLVTGDVFTPQRYPVIDFDDGGSINGLIAGINRILRITVPARNEEGGTFVIPGHGHLCDEADVSDYRDMVTIVRDRVQDAINRKMPLDQVKAAKLTRDYDGIYASAEYTGDMFVEAVYRSLTSIAAKGPAATGSPAKPPAGNKR